MGARKKENHSPQIKGRLYKKYIKVYKKYTTVYQWNAGKHVIVTALCQSSIFTPMTDTRHESTQCGTDIDGQCGVLKCRGELLDLGTLLTALVCELFHCRL